MLRQVMLEPHKYSFPSIERCNELENYYRIDDTTIPDAFGATLLPEFADLVDVAMAIYVADRRSPRRQPRVADPYGSRWQRHFSIRLPLRQSERWRSSHVADKLRQVLEWFTEDQWEFDFVQRNANGRPSESQGHLFTSLPKPPVAVALFSGGLDSLAGLCHQLREQPEHSFVLFSGSTSGRVGLIQSNLRKELQSHFRKDILHVTVPFNLRRYNADDLPEEKTQRSRGFVVLSLGAITALMAGSDMLYIHESGIGALNLPYNESQIGTHNTRAVHPHTLVLMGEFLSLLLERPFTFINPFQFSTKAEMCSVLLTEGLGHLASQSVSCDGFPQREKDKAQCGVCTSCLLRRQALYIAGMAQFDPPKYRFDIMRPETIQDPNRLYQLWAMREQVEVFQECLRSPQPWEKLAATFPILELTKQSISAHTGQDATSVERSILRLLQTYVEEWKQVPLPTIIYQAFMDVAA